MALEVVLWVSPPLLPFLVRGDKLLPPVELFNRAKSLDLSGRRVAEPGEGSPPGDVDAEVSRRLLPLPGDEEEEEDGPQPGELLNRELVPKPTSLAERGRYSSGDFTS